MQELLKKTVRPVCSSGILSSDHFPEENNGNFLICNAIGFLGIKQYTMEYDDEGDVCALVECVSYLRLLQAGHKEVATF